MKQPVNINSDIGKLQSVIVCRPGEELEGLTPEFMERMLFDDVPYLKAAQAEHNAFVEVLKDNGAEVLYLDKLVEEALTSDELKWQFVRDFVKASKQGERRTTEAIIDYLGNMPTLDMIHKVAAGVRKNEVKVSEPVDKDLSYYMIDDYPFYLDPMPNLYFTRDPATGIGNGISLSKMHWPARRREGLLMEYVLNYHPRFKDAEIPIWHNRDGRFSVEGGDVLVLDKETIAIGISERTSAEAIEIIASNLLLNSDFRKVLAIKIPNKRAFMHLDTVFTIVDYDKFSVHPEAIKGKGDMQIYVMERANNKAGYRITVKDHLQELLRETLDLKELHFIECGDGDPIAASREQWNDGSNTLAIAPGVVVTYDRNNRTNDALRRAGVKVIEVVGSEVGRGRGGPHCMTMPILREDI